MKKSVCAVVLGLAMTGSAFAATVSVGNSTAPVGGGATAPAQTPVSFTTDGVTVGYQCNISYPTANVDATVAGANGGSCSVNDGTGTIIVSDADNDANPLGSKVSCNITFTVGGAAVAGDTFALDVNGCLFSDENAGPSPGPHTETDGAISVVSGPTPPTISIADGVANAAGVGTAAVTKVDGSGALTSGYSCTAPGGFTLTANASQSGIANGGGDPADIGFSCSPGASAVTAPMSCTITEGGTPRNVSVNLTCPALAPFNPTISSTPASGSNTTFTGGVIGQTRTSTIDFSAAGANSLGSATISCAASGAVTVSPGGLQTVTGTAQPVDQTVSCVLTDAEQTGSVTCTINDGNPSAARSVTYGYTCPAGSAFVPTPQPEVVTTNSLWSKLGLIGLLAALGMLMVGFRRNH